MTEEQMAKAFNEWMRRFIEEPDRFCREIEAVREFETEENDGKEPSYGKTCTEYLHQINDELNRPDKT